MVLVAIIPVAIGAGAGLFWGIRSFFGTVAQESARGFNFVWIALGIAILVPLILPYFFTKKKAPG